jgi:hypothetical protein
MGCSWGDAITATGQHAAWMDTRRLITGVDLSLQLLVRISHRAGLTFAHDAENL